LSTLYFPHRLVRFSALVDHTATARLQRLVCWLEEFKPGFGHRAQLMSLRSYVQAVFSDSERKSIQAMLASAGRVSSTQHSITQHL
jgi:hypothetical protein